MSEIRKIANKNPKDLSREDLLTLHSAIYDKKTAETIVNALTDLKEDYPDLYEEHVKVFVAIATNGKMPPKRWATNPYFPRR
jgi:alkylhydroperoxidase/carboxymuconolactone decarboxylase family protein YurZ